MRSTHYDILVVGAGLFGSIIARSAVEAGKSVLVVDKRNHIGGNCYSRKEGAIDVHVYGPHVVYTDDDAVWTYLSSFSEIIPCMTSPIANYRGELYNLPFNMNTFHALWGVVTPEEAKAKIESQRIPCDNPRNLEEHVLSMVGRDVYEKLVRGYAEKQYGRSCAELPASIISRMPLLFTFDNDYLHRRYQGVPRDGYDALFESILDGIKVELKTDYLEHRAELDAVAGDIVFTGPIDEYYNYRFGALDYRGRRFEHEVLETDNYQGVSIMNYTDAETPFLRMVEHKHFNGAKGDRTIVTREYAESWKPGRVPYYPIEDEANRAKYRKYLGLSQSEPRVHFGGRLGEYRYYDMQDTVKSALRMSEWLLGARGPRGETR